ncbi:Translation initiation factor eIF-2B subunit delta [Sesamum angolense]|uniref:Translation initiation factor eIF2B subunit delta n=1 Tax=Sesamum angolense TaxID=2727404 RepID=A0AAE2C5V0_9LAMI|nr:Translation initiation factor eIF-2B subunit delta [Sesamum angolense]
MDPRRVSRTVSDPKVRHVGFFAPPAPPERSQSGPPDPTSSSPPVSGISPPGNSLSPVMIPPPRQPSTDLVRHYPHAPLLSPLGDPRAAESSVAVGSYNPSDFLSPSATTDCSDDPLSPRLSRMGSSGKFAMSLPSDEFDMPVAKQKDDVTLPPNVSDGGANMEVQKEKRAAGGKPLKEKTTKAERRAIQEAQRAAKAAAKGEYLMLIFHLEIFSSLQKDIVFLWQYDPVYLSLVLELIECSRPCHGLHSIPLQPYFHCLKSVFLTGNTTNSETVQLANCFLDVLIDVYLILCEHQDCEGSKASAAAATRVNPTNTGKPGKADAQKKDNSTVTASEKKGGDRQPDKDRKKDTPHPRMQFDDENRVEKAKKRSVVKQTEARNRVELFRHLPQYEHGTRLPELESKFFKLDSVHPAVYKVGLQFLAGEISGGNARCIAMLQAFQESIKDYSTPPEKALFRDLTTKINSYVSFLIECRPLSISMGNAIRFLKTRIAKLPLNLSESEAKANLISDIERFINEKIIIADKVIVKHAVTKIRDGDVLLTYASSSAVEMILVQAHELGKQFRVVIVDSRPKLEGQRLLRRLVGKGICCTYTHINAVSYVMHEATKVFLGASSVLSNGTVYSRVGTACVSMVAHQFRVPVLICCEAYKFHERVQLDSICFNELGDPDAVSRDYTRKEINSLDGWANSENLQRLNLIYDATPSDYVSMIITDYGMVPPTSVPVIVREYRRDQLWL